MRFATKTMLWFGAIAVVAMIAAPMQTAASNANAESAAKEFRTYLEADWKLWMVESPEMATYVGFSGQNRRWSDTTPAGYAASEKHLRDSLAELKKIDRNALPAKEKLNYDLYQELLETAIEGLQYGDDPSPFRGVVPGNRWMPVNQMSSPADAADLFAIMPHAKVSDYEDILARMETLHTQIDNTIAWMEEGLKKGYSPPKVTMRDVPKQMEDIAPADPMKSALLEPFRNFPSQISQLDRERLARRSKQIYTGSMSPAFRKLREYLVNTYIPACRDSIAASALPNGAAAYAYHIRWETTVSLTPQQIHEVGLAEVNRIRGEMGKVIASSGFKGSFHDFTEFLRTDPRFYYTKADDLLDGYRVIDKKIDPELAHEFGKLPRLPYGVQPVPDYKAPSQTTAYYQPGSPEVGRPGYFTANTYKLDSRPKWEMEALALHESVPGHHLQFALAQEQQGLPEFRKNVGYSAFVEGWGLYAESLGEELGMYKDPYSKFGQLTYEMWRAVRLVVDTGMHSMGWTRQQSIDYFRENTGKTDQDITVEVDRYIVWPGQALAYKLGQLKIRELRTRAEKELGPKFDIRAFHDAVLEEGALPLGILESHISAWIPEEKSR